MVLRNDRLPDRIYHLIQLYNATGVTSTELSFKPCAYVVRPPPAFVFSSLLAHFQESKVSH